MHAPNQGEKIVQANVTAPGNIGSPFAPKTRNEFTQISKNNRCHLGTERIFCLPCHEHPIRWSEVNISFGNVEKSRQRRSRPFAVLTY